MVRADQSIRIHHDCQVFHRARVSNTCCRGFARLRPDPDGIT
ncbi:hypothetical protein L915_03297 [Phytophthora nicotianae]|uniref:Uncharacterized protein n=1 Tax=Phytophthora nicotianae TaxID=4792 RepID=W2HE65_PHYNI|nr:hypothetical protein L915_03297 [Phytophthora nicotianae]